VLVTKLLDGACTELLSALVVSAVVVLFVVDCVVPEEDCAGGFDDVDCDDCAGGFEDEDDDELDEDEDDDGVEEEDDGGHDIDGVDDGVDDEVALDVALEEEVGVGQVGFGGIDGVIEVVGGFDVPGFEFGGGVFGAGFCWLLSVAGRPAAR
jgi:hypothetical protein